MDDHLETAPCGFLSFADDGTILRANAALRRLLGCPDAGLAGQAVETLLPAGSRLFLRSYFLPLLTLEGAAEEVYLVLRHGDGPDVPVVVNAVRRERDGAAVIDCAVMSMRRRAALEDELVAARREAEEATRAEVRANRQLEAFSYSVSHDLKAPLRAIDGLALIVLEDHGPVLPAEAHEILVRLRGSARRMSALIDDLLEFARLGRRPLVKRLVEPAEIVRACLDELRAELAGRTVAVEVGELPACSADPALLHQVWLNLLSNALKYSRRRAAAVITIGGASSDGETRYFVTDNGVGFDTRQGERLFGVFQRLHGTDEYEGTGIGLAIVERIVERHGGRVWAAGEPDRGATFTFTLGRDEPTPAAGDPGPPVTP